LEHVPNPKEIIRECHRLLRAKEQLLVYVPHGRSLSMRLIKSNSISSWMLFHFQLFARKVLGAVDGRSRLYRYSNLWQLSHFVAPFESYAIAKQEPAFETELFNLASFRVLSYWLARCESGFGLGIGWCRYTVIKRTYFDYF